MTIVKKKKKKKKNQNRLNMTTEKQSISLMGPESGFHRTLFRPGCCALEPETPLQQEVCKTQKENHKTKAEHWISFPFFFFFFFFSHDFQITNLQSVLGEIP